MSRELGPYQEFVRLNGIVGKSGDMLLGTLVGLVDAMPAWSVYLEVGVFRGLSLINVAAHNPTRICYGIDDFSQFNPNGLNKEAVESGLRSHGVNARLLDRDFEDALLNFGDRVGVYFIDGPHDYRSQYLCLEFAKRHLISHGVILVDDANYEHVRRANNDWLRSNSDWALAKEYYTSDHPRNMAGRQLEAAEKGWWNGVNILLHDPDHAIPRMLPPVSQSRDRYFNDHIIHSSKYAELMGSISDIFGKTDPASLNALFNGSLHFNDDPFSSRFSELNMHWDN